MKGPALAHQQSKQPDGHTCTPPPASSINRSGMQPDQSILSSSSLSSPFVTFPGGVSSSISPCVSSSPPSPSDPRLRFLPASLSSNDFFKFGNTGPALFGAFAGFLAARFFFDSSTSSSASSSIASSASPSDSTLTVSLERVLFLALPARLTGVFLAFAGVPPSPEPPMREAGLALRRVLLKCWLWILSALLFLARKGREGIYVTAPMVHLELSPKSLSAASNWCLLGPLGAMDWTRARRRAVSSVVVQPAIFADGVSTRGCE